MEQEMKYIYAVYQHASFTKAANALYITQPALSIAVSKVEARIGMPLFDRASKPLKLTKAGELYIQKYSEIRNLENELTQQLNDLSSLQTGTLKIGGSHYFNSRVLPPVLVAFAKKYPGIDLELKEARADDLMQMLYDQEIDLTFNCSEKPKDSFRRFPCFVDTLLLSVPRNFAVADLLREFALSSEDILQKKHQQFATPAVSLSAFSDTPFVLLTSGNDLHQRSYAMFEHANITPIVRMEVEQLATAWNLSEAGMGAAFITDVLISHPTHEVVFFKIQSPSAIRVFDLMMSDRHYISNAMTAFREAMQDYYEVHARERKLL